MDLTKLNDQTLLANTDICARRERESTCAVLHHIKEVDRRRLFSSLKFPSLFEYMVKRLKYSEDQACRRIAAMRLLRELPHLEEDINSGELNLTSLNLAQALFRREHKAGRNYSKRDKAEFIDRLKSKTKREVEHIVAEVAPDLAKPDRVVAVSQTQVELRFVADKSLLHKIERLKGLLAHSHPEISLGELVDKLCDVAIEKFDRSSPAPARAKRKTTRRSRAAIRRAVWRRDRVCVKCASSYKTEIDHILPKALGGEDTLENLRVLCRNCNLRSAIKTFGQAKMDPFLKTD